MDFPHDGPVMWKVCQSMMTSSNGNIFRVTGHLCGHRGQWRGAFMFSLIYAWINRWVNKAGDLRRYCAHYDVIVMRMTIGEHWFKSNKLSFEQRANYCVRKIVHLSCTSRVHSFSLCILHKCLHKIIELIASLFEGKIRAVKLDLLTGNITPIAKEHHNLQIST